MLFVSSSRIRIRSSHGNGRECWLDAADGNSSMEKILQDGRVPDLVFSNAVYAVSPPEILLV